MAHLVDASSRAMRELLRRVAVHQITVDEAVDILHDWPNRISTNALGHVRAPFTPEEQRHLNEFQQSGKFHPFTCPDSSHGELIAGRHWYCSSCDYTQYWAHDFMANGRALANHAELEPKER